MSGRYKNDKNVSCGKVCFKTKSETGKSQQEGLLEFTINISIHAKKPVLVVRKRKVKVKYTCHSVVISCEQ